MIDITAPMIQGATKVMHESGYNSRNSKAGRDAFFGRLGEYIMFYELKALGKKFSYCAKIFKKAKADFVLYQSGVPSSLDVKTLTDPRYEMLMVSNAQWTKRPKDYYALVSVDLDAKKGFVVGYMTRAMFTARMNPGSYDNQQVPRWELEEVEPLIRGLDNDKR